MHGPALTIEPLEAAHTICRFCLLKCSRQRYQGKKLEKTSLMVKVWGRRTAAPTRKAQSHLQTVLHCLLCGTTALNCSSAWQTDILRAQVKPHCSWERTREKSYLWRRAGKCLGPRTLETLLFRLAGSRRGPHFWDPGWHYLPETEAKPGQQKTPPPQPRARREALSKQQQPTSGGGRGLEQASPSESHGEN